MLPLLETDLMEIFLAVREERLAGLDIKWKDAHACCVILASGGYPERYGSGYPISFGETGGAMIYHAGTRRLEDGAIVTAGGRVLGVTAVGADLGEAVAGAYDAASKISFEKRFYRGDIGRRALQAGRK